MVKVKFYDFLKTISETKNFQFSIIYKNFYYFYIFFDGDYWQMIKLAKIFKEQAKQWHKATSHVL